MHLALTRRSLATLGIGAAFCRTSPLQAQALPAAPDSLVTQALGSLAALEAKRGGRLGVVALDTPLTAGLAIAPMSALRCAARTNS
jgi:hypothetical protein